MLQHLSIAFEHSELRGFGACPHGRIHIVSEDYIRDLQPRKLLDGF